MNYSTDKEAWKDVDGYEGFYQVSNLGRIRSLDRTITRSDGMVAKVKGKILKTRVSKGYVLINLNKNGVCKTVSLARLIATTFIQNEQNKPEVNHIDENKINNAVTNLEWCTPKENANHGSRNQRIANTLINAKNARAKGVAMLDKETEEVLREFRTINEAYRYLDRVANGNISKACRENKRTVYGYKWRFI